MSRPPLVHVDDIAQEPGRYPAPFDAELLSAGRELSRGLGRALGAWHEHLPPGRRTSRTHAHLREEEIVYVLSGHPVLRWFPHDGAPEDVPLRPGHLLSFRPGTGHAHSIGNPGPEPADLLVVGTRHPGERIRYPEDPELEAWRAAHRPLRQWTHTPAPPGATAYRIATARLELRPWDPEDATGLFALTVRNHARLAQWMPWALAAPELEATLAAIRQFRSNFDRDREWVYGMLLDGQPVGSIGLHPRVGPGGLELGYWIDAEHEGKGLVSEAAAAVTRVALARTDVERVEIRCAPENHRSRAVPERLGFRREALLPRRLAMGSAVLDLEVWTAFAADLKPTAAFDAWDALGRAISA